MTIEIHNKEDGSIDIKTMDGTVSVKELEASKESFDDTEPLSMLDLIKNIWSNAKVKDSILTIEHFNS